MTNSEFRKLFYAPKRTELPKYILPGNKQKSIQINLHAASYPKTPLLLDVSRSTLHLEKRTLQERANRTIILCRVDFSGSAHINPPFNHNKVEGIDAEMIEMMRQYDAHAFKNKESHIHFYIDGYGDKWAFPLCDFIDAGESLVEQVEKFCDLCNIEKPRFYSDGLL